MIITIARTTGGQFTMEINSFASILEVKAKIMVVFRIPIARQVLMKDDLVPLPDELRFDQNITLTNRLWLDIPDGYQPYTVSNLRLADNLDYFSRDPFGNIVCR